MSYLDTLRFHFAGTFFSNPSTVNNNAVNYEKQPFNRNESWRRTNASWNPDGANAFRFQEVKVSGAVLADGAMVNPASDAILSLNVESRTRMPARLVDLDPDQQLVSMIFGLTITLTNENGDELLEASMEAAPFTDIWWSRGDTGGNDEMASATYQSILNVLSWGDVSSSPFLQQLKAASPDMLSIKFNLDGYSMGFGTPGFATGRIVGTIGPATSGEPKHLTLGRHFEVQADNINYCTGIHDTATNKFRIDLGNALPVSPSKGPINTALLGKLILGCRAGNGTVTEIAEIPYAAGNWYETTGGIVEVPANRELTAAENALIGSSVVCIISETAAGKIVAAQELNDGAHVRADMFVARMNPGDETDITFYATQFGKPLPNASIAFVIEKPQHVPNIPPGGLNFAAPIQTNQAGMATLKLRAGDPGNNRFYYDFGRLKRVLNDGQIYRVLYGLNGRRTPNPADLLSVLVWNNFTPDDPITWHGSMKQVLSPYGDLYPIMTRDQNIRLDMADYEQVSQQRLRIAQVMKLSINDSMYMPITRDLSRARQNAVIRWLENVGADGKPFLGTPPSVVAGFAPPISEDVVAEYNQPVDDPSSKKIFVERLKKNLPDQINLTSNDQDK